MIRYREGYKYQLHDSVTFALPAEFCDTTYYSDFLELSQGMLTIRQGYSWDGASGPTIDSKSSMQASLIHDALYQMIREGGLPKAMKAEADKLFHVKLLEDGMDRIRANIWYWAVKKFGKAAIIHNKDILVAP